MTNNYFEKHPNMKYKKGDKIVVLKGVRRHNIDLSDKALTVVGIKETDNGRRYEYMTNFDNRIRLLEREIDHKKTEAI